MDDTTVADRVERALVRHAATTGGPGYRLRRDRTWLTLHPAAATIARHGWKLHVSARAAAFADLVDRLVPVLLAQGCTFKLARSVPVLHRLNDGYSSPAAVGKAFTIYPDQDRVRDLGLYLADLLRGEPGPRVLSDRRVAPDAPVYYRYGPFTQSWNADARGRLMTLIHGPGGEEFGALATMRYRQPAWTTDPFTGVAGGPGDDDPAPDGGPAQLLGGYYRVTGGIYESGRGNVYRAVDERDGATVVVKQARAHVDEHDLAGDVRLRLRNERRVLQALAGAAGVPRFVDHFRHGTDEFLVTTDAGPTNLEQDVAGNGRYLPAGHPDAPGDGRTLERLAAQLARTVLDLHGRGVVVRDLTTRNIVVDGDRITLIDLGLADYEGLHVPGGTPGYAPARQCRHEPPRDTDDLYALGMTLLFAAHGLHPVTLGDDLDLPARRALQTLRDRYGERPGGVPGAIADLIGGDPARARQAAARLAGTGESPSTVDTDPSTVDIGSSTVDAGPSLVDTTAPGVVARRRALPAPPRVDPALAAEIRDNLLADLLDQTRRVLAAPASRSIAHDASVYSGTAGIGLELLAHLDRPGVAGCLDELVPFTVRAARDVDLPPGLMAGRTGVDVFLHTAARHGFTAAGYGYAGPYLPGTGWKPEGDDIIGGAAGVGLGHLLLYRATGDPAHLAIAYRCAESIVDHPVPETRTGTDPLPEPAAVEPSAGRAHGLAGTTELLLCLGRQTGDADLLAHGARRAAVLAARARSLAARSRTRYAASLAVSWCQGLAGITQSVRYAAAVLHDVAPDGAELAALAGELGDTCVAFLPRVSVPSQCCGLAGVGNMLLDLAGLPGGERFRDGAARAAGQMLLRGAGSTAHPLLIADDPEDNSASWAFGVAGTLGFFRRLAAGEGTAGVPLPDWAGLAAGTGATATGPAGRPAAG